MTDKSRHKNRGIVIRLGGYILKEWHLFFIATVLTLVSNQLSLLGPRYSGAAIDAITLSSGAELSEVWENVIKMIVCYAGSAVISYFLSGTKSI